VGGFLPQIETSRHLKNKTCSEKMTSRYLKKTVGYLAGRQVQDKNSKAIIITK
jgi:hypothetical protein